MGKAAQQQPAAPMAPSGSGASSGGAAGGDPFAGYPVLQAILRQLGSPSPQGATMSAQPYGPMTPTAPGGFGAPQQPAQAPQGGYLLPPSSFAPTGYSLPAPAYVPPPRPATPPPPVAPAPAPAPAQPSLPPATDWDYWSVQGAGG